MRQLRWGMIGGGEGAFIGAVHRMAARLDGRYQLVAGVFSSDAEKTKRSAIALGVDPSRAYPSVDAMIAAEGQRPDGVEVVSVVTPNHMHYPQSAACLEAGLDVICDKPLTTNLADAEKLVALAASKQALVRRHVQLHRLPDDPARQAADRRRAHRQAARGAGGISAGLARDRAREERAEAGELAHGSQAGRRGRARRHRLACIPARRIRHRCARSAKSPPTCRRSFPAACIDDNVNVLLRFANGARGSLWASQVAIGHLNSHRLRVYGDAGSIQWFQERPEELLVVEQGAAPRNVRRGDPGTPTSSVGTAGRPSRRVHRSLLAALHGFRRARDRATRERARPRRRRCSRRMRSRVRA